MPIEEKKEQSPAHSSRIAKKIDQELTISSISVGLVTAGSLFYSPLSLVALPGLCYQSLDLGKEAFYSLKNKTQVNRAFLDLLVFGLCLSQGYYILGSLALCSHYFTNKVLFKSNQEVFQTLSEAVGKEPSMAWLLKDGVEIEVPTKTLQVGQSVVIHPGELIPVDGQITDGVALVDERMLSGSSPPTIKNVGEQVVCGNILLAGRIVVQIQRVGDSTCIAKMATELTQATEKQTRLQHWSQKLSPIIALSQLMGGSLASFIFHPMSVAAMMGIRSDYDQIAPLEIATWLEESFQHGILIRNTQVLERLKQVDTIVIDHAINQPADLISAQLLNQLRSDQIKSIYLLAADSEAKELRLAVDHYLTEVSKQAKVNLLRELQAAGASVCYIADHISQESQQACTLSITPSKMPPTEAPLADIFLMDGTLQQVECLFKMAKHFDQHSKKTFMASMAPPLLALSGPFFFKSALVGTLLLNQIGMFSGLKHAQRINQAEK